MAKYKIEFKTKVVKEYLERNIGYKELAKKKHSIPDRSTVRRWVKEFKEKGIEWIRKLREDNYYLKMEVDILKKKIQFSQMTQEEINRYLRSLDH